MDNQLIDQALKGLLAVPHAERNPEQLAAWINLIVETCGIELSSESTLQLEHLKLFAALQLLAKEHGFTEVACRHEMGTTTWRKALSADIKLPGCNELIFGFGETAEEVLADLRERIHAHAQQSVDAI